MINHLSVPEFFEAHENDVFIFWKYKKMFTPYEIKNEFEDESCFESINGDYCRVVECIQRRPGRYMIGCQTLLNIELYDEDLEFSSRTEYYDLQDIHIELARKIEKAEV